MAFKSDVSAQVWTYWILSDFSRDLARPRRKNLRDFVERAGKGAVGFRACISDFWITRAWDRWYQGGGGGGKI